MMAARIVIPALALLLAACGQGGAPKEADKPAEPPVAPLARASSSLSYKCEGDLTITAVYGVDGEGKPDATIFIRGTDFQMHQVPAASGARYATIYGLEAGLGLIWWEKDGTAMLQQAPEAKIADPAAATTVRTCTVKK